MVTQSIVLVVCGGMHDPQITDSIIALIKADEWLSQLALKQFPSASRLAVLSGASLRSCMDGRWTGESKARLMIWAFSAGCIGAAALANYWQRYRGEVLALFMVDGWGVPWSQAAPLHRLSHDAFTNISSNCLGEGVVNFVASPAVDHHQLWQAPQRVTGQQIMTRHLSLSRRWVNDLNGFQPSLSTTAADFLCTWSRYHLVRAVGDSC